MCRCRSQWRSTGEADGGVVGVWGGGIGVEGFAEDDRGMLE